MNKQKSILHQLTLIGIIAILGICQSCNYAKYVPKNNSILWQNKIKIKGKLNKEINTDLTNQFQAAMGQEPNTVILGLDISTLGIGKILPRNKLIMYNLFHKKIEKELAQNDSVSYMIKQHLAQLPVIFDSSLTTTTINNIKGILFNAGYFYAKVNDSVYTNKRRKTFLNYTIVSKYNYLIHSTIYKIKNNKLNQIVEDKKQETVLKNGEALTFKKIATERDRLAKIITDNGYYNFRPSAINIIIDTVSKDELTFINNEYDQIIDKNKEDTSTVAKVPTADIIITINDTIGTEPVKAYFTKKVIVYLDKKVEPNKITNNYKETIYNNVIYRYYQMPINFKAISDNIFIQPNSMYNVQNFTSTLNRLNSINVFKSVRIENKLLPDSNSLDCIIQLEMANKYADIIEFDASSGTLYSIGSGLKYTFNNNNIMKGASQLNITLQGGLQAVNDTVHSFFKGLELAQYNYGLSSNLVFPKILSPFNLNNRFKNATPQTSIGIGYSYINRIKSYILESDNLNVIYSWHQNNKINWRVTPLFLTRVNTSHISDAILQQTLNDEGLKRNLEKYFIIGSSASFVYDNKTELFQWHHSYCRISLEAAGGLLTAVRKIFTDSIDPRIRNYAKVETEVKHYINSRKTSWVNRCFVSLGLPYNNQNNLPLIKQLSAGGSYSLRGWGNRQIGPGSSQDSTGYSLLNMGEIKIEGNSEFRFKMLKLFSGNINLEGATFADVGNIWEYKNTSNPAREFNFSKFYPDLAADIGLGARLDFNLFLIRLDWAMQVKKPYVSENNGWTINSIDLGNHAWRKDNIKLQFGINYPF